MTRPARRAVLAGTVALGTARRAAAAPREVTISLASRSLVAAAPTIARELGLFDRNGLQPRLVVMDSANAATTALIARAAEVAVSGSAEAVAAQARGQNVVIAVSTYAGLSGSLVLSATVARQLPATPQAAIADRLRALDGLLIASTSPTSSFTISFRAAARAAGANPRFAFMALPAMLAALESGTVQGFIATPPFWVVPVLKASGVLWVSAPKGELPDRFTPASSANIQLLRSTAEGDPALLRALRTVFADYRDAIEQRPDLVKAAVARLYPEMTAETIDTVFAEEAPAWVPRQLTQADIAHEIAYVKASGTALPPGLDAVDPAAMLLP